MPETRLQNWTSINYSDKTSEKIMHASKVGFPCDRNLWYSVNEGYKEKISERSQRIFDVGTYLEPLVVKWLEKDGWFVEYNPGSLNAQKEVSIKLLGGYLTGHPDAIIFEHVNSPIILIDIKTMNDRAFTLWKREGTLKKYPQYVDQLHIYAKGLSTTVQIDKLAIVGVNKNNADIHFDFFDYDETRMNEIIKRAERIFALNEAPEPGERMQDWCCSYCGYSWLCELFQKKKSAEVGDKTKTTYNPEIIHAIEQLKEARDLTAQAKELDKEAKKILDEKVKSKGIKSLRGGNLILTFTEVAGKIGFDKETFKKEHPEMLNQYTTIGQSSIRYDIKEA